MKRLLLVLPVGIVLLLLFNLASGTRSSDGLLEAAYARCGEEGLSRQDLLFVEKSCSDGRFGFGGSGHVDFQVKNADPPKTLRVELRKRANLLGWRAVGCEEVRPSR
jgi:hypothetical protein